jgi:hypothetical protein
MKTIKLTIAFLIASLPLIVNAIVAEIMYPKIADTPIFVTIWTLLLDFYLLLQFRYYADKFCKWFDSKLK